MMAPCRRSVSIRMQSWPSSVMENWKSSRCMRRGRSRPCHRRPTFFSESIASTQPDAASARKFLDGCRVVAQATEHLFGVLTEDGRGRAKGGDRVVEGPGDVDGGDWTGSWMAFDSAQHIDCLHLG